MVSNFTKYENKLFAIINSIKLDFTRKEIAGQNLSSGCYFGGVYCFCCLF